MEQKQLISRRVDLFNGQEQHYVKEIQRSEIEKRPAVYRWWFNAIPELIIQSEDVQIDKILTALVDGKTYYALYVGKASSAYKRLYCHLPNSKRIGFKTSTLRRTLRALLCKSDKTPEECARIVDAYILDHAILEWRYFDTEEAAKNFESECIKDGYYPLNNSENEQLRQWTKKLTELRKVFN